MLLLLIKSLGWLAARSPESLLRIMAAVLGDFMFFALRSRRRLILSNLHHAFPEKSRAWQHGIGRESCRRMVETGLLSLATPFLSEQRVRQMATLTAEWHTLAHELAKQPRPVLITTAHMALWEAQTWVTCLTPVPLPEFGTIYRPLDNAAADAFVKASRERFGIRLLSRKEGFAEALKILRRKGIVGLLFDQNAGMQGALTLLLDRVCSSTELPGLLTAKFDADVRVMYPRRKGFWRVEFGLDQVSTGGTTEGTTLALNRWLESALRGDDNLCASWLWAHARWRNQDIPERRLRLEAKRDLLAADLAARGLTAVPRRTRIWIRMPNWLGDVVMAVPLLRALRASRPDAEITLVAKPQFIPLLSAWNVADRLYRLPPAGPRYWASFWALRSEFIDVWILFTNSARGDLEAWLGGARQRFGIVRPGRKRPLLSHAYHVPPSFSEARNHQVVLWENFLQHFGLNAAPDFSPVVHPVHPSGGSSAHAAIGLIPGSENSPEKRWPVEHWRAVINAMPERHFVVFGTANDLPIASAVSAGFEAVRVENLAGRTTLPAFAERLAACRVLIANDTGGMHLANALGVPVIALFGPTNPDRTGPVFNGTTRILQPAGCAPTGGGSLAELRPEVVAAEVSALLNTAGQQTPLSA